MKQPFVKLRDGTDVPAIGLGTWKSEKGEVAQAIRTAVDAGYRHFDCAPVYENEKEIGEAFHAIFSEGKVKREDLWITSKLWCNHHERAAVKPGLLQTLSDLQLDYLDLYLMHWPIALKRDVYFPEKGEGFLSPDEAPITEAWKGMDGMRKEGLCRHIGVSNFSPQRMIALCEQAEHAPEVNQVECHPFLSQVELREACEARGVALTAYCPLGSGKEKGEEVPDLLNHKVLVKIARDHDSTTAQVALAWNLQRGAIIIPKSTNEQRQLENLEAGDIHLGEDELRAIDALDQNYRYIDGTVWAKGNSPYSVEWLWEGAELDRI